MNPSLYRTPSAPFLLKALDNSSTREPDLASLHIAVAALRATRLKLEQGEKKPRRWLEDFLKMCHIGWVHRLPPSSRLERNWFDGRTGLLAPRRRYTPLCWAMGRFPVPRGATDRATPRLLLCWASVHH